MKTVALQIRVELDEKEAFEHAASLVGLTVSGWVRERLRLAAIRELESVGMRIPFVQSVPLRKPDHE
ncbi:MAG: hypothetical protein FWF31_10270 [Desulfobulbus sp.]|nr:hypothetical protein [Desulfobulbus sp.]